MAYSDVTLDTLHTRFDLQIQVAPLFEALTPVPIPAWLTETLAKGLPMALGSEKARSEFIIAPILLTVRDLSNDQIAIYSGQRLDSDPQAGLVGECDFIISKAPPLPIIQSPILSMVEAKKNDIESGLGQCAAQMLGAYRFNQRENAEISIIYGCVTTGEVWQFLKLERGIILTFDRERYYINQLEMILALFQAIVTPHL